MLNDECWLLLPGRPRRRVDGRGLLIGRSMQADIHLPDAVASRRHGLVLLDLEGPLLIPLGQRPVLVNGAPVLEPRRLVHGDALTFPGLDCHLSHQRADMDGGQGWVVAFRPRSGHSSRVPAINSLPPEGVNAGGGNDDDLHLPDWPAEAVNIRPSPGGGWVARVARGVSLSRRPSPDADGRVVLQSGDRLVYNGETLQLLDPAVCAQCTLGEVEEEHPLRVVLAPVPPAGGQVTVLLRGGEYTAFVPGVRFDLLQVLLFPPAGLAAGEALPDAVVLPLVWGRHPPQDRKAVTTQAQRLRRDLDKAGLDGASLVLREHGRTRFVLAMGAQVELAQER